MENGKVEIMLDKPRYLRFEFNSWCAVEAAAGVSLRTTPNPLSLGMRGERAMLYGGLIVDDPYLTLEKAGRFFDSFDPNYILKKIMEAVAAANPEASKSPNVERLEVGTGANSSEQPAA